MPRQSPLDLISRLVMLALAVMVTLSVVGVIEAIPRGAMQDLASLERPRQQQLPQQPQPEPPRADREAPEPRPTPAEPRQPEPGPGAAPGGSVYAPSGLAPAPPEDNDVERWLEAITYALMALVGLLAIATIILWRSLRERRRMADALHRLASDSGEATTLR